MRKIIHLDMDCFYAAVEMRDDPSLLGKPIAVGGGRSRGVVATCNYEARKYGVSSAMSGGMARRLCPNIIFVPVNMDKYKQESAIIRKLMLEITPVIEPVSLDEAYLDVSNCKIHNNIATLIARDLKERIYQTTGLTASAGVAPNKFLAKVASDWNKPNGIKVIPPERVADFVKELPVGKIPGVGKVSVNKLARRGIKLCKDLYKYDEEELQQMFGKFGELLYNHSRGIDERKVSTKRIRKSLSVETTFAEDIISDEQCYQELDNLLEELKRRLAKYSDQYSPNGLFVKLKFSDFISTTKQKVDGSADLENAIALYNEARQRHNKPIRLLGLGVYFNPKRETRSAGNEDAKKQQQKAKPEATTSYNLFSN